MNRKLTLMKNIRILAAAELRPNVRELSFAFFKKNDTYKRKPLDIDQKFVYIDPVIKTNPTDYEKIRKPIRMV